jgi:hypothetical protein
VTHRDPMQLLGELLDAAGARVTLDPARNATHPCVRCRTTSEPRDLVQIGTYTRPMGGNLRPGDPIVRPMCAACRAATEPSGAPDRRVGRYTHLVVIAREGVPEVREFENYDDAATWHDEAGSQWSESYLTEVIKGPLT